MEIRRGAIKGQWILEAEQANKGQLAGGTHAFGGVHRRSCSTSLKLLGYLSSGCLLVGMNSAQRSSIPIERWTEKSVIFVLADRSSCFFLLPGDVAYQLH